VRNPSHPNHELAVDNEVGGDRAYRIDHLGEAMAHVSAIAGKQVNSATDLGCEASEAIML
jgi:hypothetical protein